MKRGFLVIDEGPAFSGTWLGGEPRAGEVVFNTSHNGYEEIATDPSYYGQIMIMCAPQQGNYGVDKKFWESRQLWIQGFASLDIFASQSEDSWLGRLKQNGIPTLTHIDTRKLVLFLREKGTRLGALLPAETEAEAREKSLALIQAHRGLEKDWAHAVSRKEPEVLPGEKSNGHKVAVLDFGCKENILRELKKRTKEVKIFPARTSASEVLAYQPDGVMLSNGPGDPENVQEAVGSIQEMVGKLPIFGICMGHQLLARALGAATYPLKFGHRGANHPVKNLQTGEIFVTSQNHGYAIDNETLPSDVQLTHLNLNDRTVSGIEAPGKKCFSVQFHPESHPGPREGAVLFDQFIDWMSEQ